MAEDKYMKQLVGDWLANNRDIFDHMVIATAATNTKFFRSAQPVLCRLEKFKKTEWIDDFHKPGLLPLYRAVHDYNSMVLGPLPKPNEETGFVPMSVEMLSTFLQMYVQNGEMLSADEIPLALENYRYQLGNFAKPETVTWVSAAFNAWLMDQKVSVTMRDSLNRRDREAAIDQLNTIRAAIHGRENSFDMHGFGSGLDNEELDVERIPTGFMPLDVSLGGGLGKKEATLVIAAPGVGKTVFATQMTSMMAIKRNVRVLLISTEQKHRELEPRIVSAQCNIPFNLIKDKFRPEILQPDQLERYKALRRGLHDNNFQILNWSSSRDKNIFSVIDAMVEATKEKMGGLDVLFLDWLGAALGEHATNDPNEYRLILKRGANAFVDALERHDLVGAVFAQAHPTLGINHRRVDSSTLSECKTLGERMTNILGITGMLTKEDDGEAEMIFQERQSFYISKARKSEGNAVPMKRDFGYQRFGYV